MRIQPGSETVAVNGEEQNGALDVHLLYVPFDKLQIICYDTVSPTYVSPFIMLAESELEAHFIKKTIFLQWSEIAELDLRILVWETDSSLSSFWMLVEDKYE